MDPQLSYRTFEKAHGQMEECIYTIAKVKANQRCFFSDWAGIKAVVRFDKHTEKINSSRHTHEIRYYITSLDSDAHMCGKGDQGTLAGRELSARLPRYDVLR